MAEQPQGNKTKVLSLLTNDGGVFMGHHGQKTSLPGQLSGIEMELDRSLGGVVVKWEAKDKAKKKKLIPISHCREVELEA